MLVWDLNWHAGGPQTRWVGYSKGKLNHVTNDMVKAQMGVVPVLTGPSEIVQVLDWTIDTPVIGIAEDQVWCDLLSVMILRGAHLRDSRCTLLPVRVAGPGCSLDRRRIPLPAGNLC